jgi:glucosamine--fructose-6-phosphate aminotransferase (isomerizing)
VIASATLDDSGKPVDAEELLEHVRPLLTSSATAFAEKLHSGVYNGQMEASTSVRTSSLFRYATGMSRRDTFQLEFHKVGTAGVILEDLSAALATAIDELTRPVDAIKHQAKTVTVGISRGDESLLQVPLVAAVMDTGAGRDSVPYSSLRSLAEMDPAVSSIDGFVRYGISGGVDLATAELSIIDRGGVGAQLSSRVETDSRLRGTKALVAREQELMVALGRSDGRSVVIVPEIASGLPVALVLLHVTIEDDLPPATTRAVLQGYRRRYQALRDAVTETDDFDEQVLAAQPMIDLLTVPILDLADRWRK